MATPSATFTEMVTSTLRATPFGNKLGDAISGQCALYSYLRENGKVNTYRGGGYEIQVPLIYAENGTYQRYSGMDALDITQSDVVTSAKYDWMQASIHVVASGREIRLNSGKEQMIDLVKTRLDAAKKTAANNLSVDLYSSGSLTNQVGGLAHLLQNAGTGTVGGIDSSTWTSWQNQYQECSGTNAWTKSTIKGEMNKLWLKCVRGSQKPDLIVSSHDMYSAYWEGLQDNQRYMNANSKAAAGFQSLAYGTADVIFDSNSNFGTTAEKMYFINTDTLQLVEHSQARWTVQEDKQSVNQDGVIIPLLWMGNLVCNDRGRNGVLIDAA